MSVKKIAILTSGGDCQGMNALINILVRVANERQIDVLGVMNGYKGLCQDDFIKLDNFVVENITSLGGTILKTSRYLDFKKDEVVKLGVKNLSKRKVDALIVIGGDGSFKGAMALSKFGVKIICIPATIDNDLRYTSRCLGFDTAVNNAVKYIENVEQTMEALNRGVVIEVMGRYCGDIALYCAVSTACDVIALPENPINQEELLDRVKYCIEVKKKIPVVVVAEKMFDVKEIAKILSEETNIEFKYSVVGYIQRGGSPSVADKALAMQFGVKAIELVENGIFGKALGFKDNKIFDLDLFDALNSDYNFNYELLNLFYLLNYKK